MNKDERLETINELESIRNSRVITYLTADRGVAATPISADVLRIIYDHLRAIGHVDQIDLFLYSRGGDAMLPWPLVNTIRSFCDKFCVLIPFRAYSAATLISLGADEIGMTALGQLTPVEPTITMALNPSDPANPSKPLGINVEDVAAFMQFVRERGEIGSEEGRAQALATLGSHMHPVALGHLHRFHKLASQQAEKLLQLHMDKAHEGAEIEAIVKSLVTTLWAHDYKISRQEALQLGLKVILLEGDQEIAVWKLFEGYETAMQLRKPIQPTTGAFPPGKGHLTMADLKMAYVESTIQTDCFELDLALNRPLATTPAGQPQQFGPQVQVTVSRQEWNTE